MGAVSIGYVKKTLKKGKSQMGQNNGFGNLFRLRKNA
jgi:hypothetical protein